MLLAGFLLVEWLGREKQYAIEGIAGRYNPALRWSFYLLLTGFILVFQGEQQEFIYFQF